MSGSWFGPTSAAGAPTAPTAPNAPPLLPPVPTNSNPNPNAPPMKPVVASASATAPTPGVKDAKREDEWCGGTRECLAAAEAAALKVEQLKTARDEAAKDFKKKISVAEKEREDADAKLKTCVVGLLDHYNARLTQLKSGDWVWFRATDAVTAKTFWRRYQLFEIDTCIGSGGGKARARSQRIPPGQMGHEITLSWDSDYTDKVSEDIVFVPSTNGDENDKVMLRAFFFEHTWSVFE